MRTDLWVWMRVVAFAMAFFLMKKNGLMMMVVVPPPFFTVFTTSFGFFLCHGLMIWGALSMIEGIFHERLDRHFGGGSVDRWV